jgi:hypothetical protein
MHQLDCPRGCYDRLHLGRFFAGVILFSSMEEWARERPSVKVRLRFSLQGLPAPHYRTPNPFVADDLVELCEKTIS